MKTDQNQDKIEARCLEIAKPLIDKIEKKIPIGRLEALESRLKNLGDELESQLEFNQQGLIS